MSSRGPASAIQLIAFAVEGQHYALHLATVERIVRAVEVTPLPKAPEIVLGVINMAGRVIPVVNFRRRFRLPERDIRASDQFIIAQTATRAVALVVDAVVGVIERAAEEVVPAQHILPGVEYVEGVVKLDDGLLLIHDLTTFLSLQEERAVADALHTDG